MTDTPIRHIKFKMPEKMDYYIDLSVNKNKTKFIKRTERTIRSSLEYKDYIKFLKEHVDLDSCIFFKNVSISSAHGSRSKISIEMHHEPFTLYDYVEVVLNKFMDEGQPANDLLIADEVMRLHYENEVGLVPLSKTMHQVVHNSPKLLVPLNVVYGDYASFIDEYENYITEEMYEKLERKINMTKNLTEKDFEAIKKEFTYLDMDKVDDVEKIPVREEKEIFG